MIGLLISLIVGGFSGWMVTQLMGLKEGNVLFYCLLGIVGGLVGGVVAGLIGFSAHSTLANVILSICGGCLFAWAYQKFTGSKL